MCVCVCVCVCGGGWWLCFVLLCINPLLDHLTPN